MSTTGTTAGSAGSALEDLLAAQLGLRERKKLKTRRAIRSAAFGLFAEQGYEATTVDQIAAAAEVSPSTFFRYFPTKEDLVVGDDYDPMLEAALRARPADEPLLESLRAAMVEPLRQILASERDSLLLRMRLYRANPSIRARVYVEHQRSAEMIRRILAERTGEPADSLRLRAVATAVLAAAEEASLHWADSDGAEDMADNLDAAFTALAEAFR